MDIIKPKSNHGKFSPQQKIIAASVVTLIILLIISSRSLNSISIERADILVASVKTGDLDVTIEGYGILKSDKQQLITAATRATVKEIILKPGATVSADSIIIKMENPELLQQVENAQQELEQLEANLRQLKVNHIREALDEDAKLSDSQARFESAKLKRLAHETLVKKGVVSQISYQEVVLNENQLAEQIDILSQRAKQLKSVHKEAINIQRQRIMQQQGRLEIAKERMQKLTVKAGIDGVLQSLSVELGQSVDAGQQIALIGSVQDLLALIRVPQTQVQQIAVGQKAIIDTRQDKIIGQVARIDPIVENNTVNIEISLPKALPASARPQLNVDGVIVTATLKNIHYIERPAHIKPNTEGILYGLDEHYQTAARQSVQFGRQAGRYIEILSKIKPGEKFIVSDLSNLKLTAEILTIKS